MRFFPRFVSSLNSWKVVSWLDTPSENGCLKQVKVGFWFFFNGLSKFLSHFLFIWDQKLKKIKPGTFKKRLVFGVFFKIFFYIFQNCSNIHRPVWTCRRWKLPEIVSLICTYFQISRFLTLAASRGQKPRLSWGPKMTKIDIF